MDALARGGCHEGKDCIVAEHKERLHEAEPEVHPEVAVHARAHNSPDRIPELEYILLQFRGHRHVLGEDDFRGDRHVLGENVLREKVLRGAVWKTVGQVGKLGSNLVKNLVLVAHVAQPDVRKDLDALVDHK